VRSTSHVDAKSVAGFDGSKTTSIAPVLSSTKRTFSQLRPPSRVRKTPLSAFGP
jgi:hypothetical protein